METTYCTLDQSIISKEEMQSQRAFLKVQTHNGQKKLVELYEDQGLIEVYYYASSGENLEEIISKYSYVSLAIYTDRKVVNGYDYARILGYEEQKLVEIILSVEKNDQPVFHQKVDVVSNEPILSSTEKWCINEDGEIHYHFEYDEQGEAFMIYDRLSFQGDFLASRVGVDEELDFSWSGMEYFKNAAQIFPT